MAARKAARTALVGLGLCMAFSCSPKPTEPTALCTADQSEACRSPELVEQMLIAPELEIVHAEEANGGRQGAKKLTVELSLDGHRERFQIKWRAHTTQHGLNHPRKEVAAHALQQAFLDPLDYVFPPTRSRCFEIEHYRSTVDSEAQPTFPELPCVFGTVSFWVGGAKRTDEAHDEQWLASNSPFDSQRFRSDLAYRRSFSDLNLLTFLASNGDTHTWQFVFVKTPKGLRAYNVDFTISFSQHRNKTLEPRENFATLQVPALHRRSVERVRAFAQHARRLSVVERLRHGPERRALLSYRHGSLGTLQSTGTSSGLRWQACSERQNCERELVVGLTQKELEVLVARFDELQSLLERGQVELF